MQKRQPVQEYLALSNNPASNSSRHSSRLHVLCYKPNYHQLINRRPRYCEPNSKLMLQLLPYFQSPQQLRRTHRLMRILTELKCTPVPPKNRSDSSLSLSNRFKENRIRKPKLIKRIRKQSILQLVQEQKEICILATNLLAWDSKTQELCFSKHDYDPVHGRVLLKKSSACFMEEHDGGSCHLSSNRPRFGCISYSRAEVL